MRSCECCKATDVEIDWYCVDDNAEVELCKPCAKKIGAHAKVELIEA